jgi:rare lipoprotein A
VKTTLLFLFVLVACASAQQGSAVPSAGLASWYGETHRGKLMANGRRFNPDKLTAASWFYPLGTRVRVVLKPELNVLNPQPIRSVVVTITDRGPARRLVRRGRVIDLTLGAFKQLADADLGLVQVIVQPEGELACAAVH